MEAELFILLLAAVLYILLNWGFRTLTEERWQILAALPTSKENSGKWRGRNLTFYGFFSATGYAFALVIFFVLLGSVGVPKTGMLLMIGIVLGLCVPASRIVAKIVEKKAYTFTVAGASFVGIILAPWLVWGGNATFGQWMGFHILPMAFLAALTVSYAFGEGIGRLACISFGCCYGKPLEQAPPFLRALFEKHAFVFTGKTRKIAYADGLDGQKVIPIQAVTSVIYCVSGLIGVYLFLIGLPTAAFLETLVITQFWRSVSEFFRADYRGKFKISAYQIMGAVSVVYGLLIAFFFFSSADISPNLFSGLEMLWDTAVILSLQAIWIAIFLYTGRSQVTGSHLSFHVIQDHI